jgi:hypothetical protein
MRAVLAIVLLGLTVSALDLTRFAALVQTGAKENDAVESVYNLLRDLKTENVQIQVQADNKNITDEDIGARIIGELTQVANINQQNWKNAKIYRESVDAQITVSLHPFIPLGKRQVDHLGPKQTRRDRSQKRSPLRSEMLLQQALR